MIQTVKKTIKKCIEGNEDLDMAFLMLRAMPISREESSPGEFLMNRCLRTLVPSLRKGIVNKKAKNKISNFEQDADKRRNLPLLHVGDQVRIHDGKCWSSVGKVVRRHDNPRSFIINTGTQLLRRNRRDLLKVPNKATSVKQPYFDDDSSYPNVGNEVNPEHINNNVGDVK